MYDAAYLSVYPFFEKAFRDRPLSAVLDSLTGVVSRACMIEFLHDLVDRKQVFTVGMIDVDNFKSYNDNYGHRIGDLVLQHVGRSLIEYMGNRGVVGRFGGDEFLVVAFIGNDYETVHSFYEHLFFQGSLGNQDAVFRRDIRTAVLCPVRLSSTRRCTGARARAGTAISSIFRKSMLIWKSPVSPAGASTIP